MSLTRDSFCENEAVENLVVHLRSRAILNVRGYCGYTIAYRYMLRIVRAHLTDGISVNWDRYMIFVEDSLCTVIINRHDGSVYC